ncbi:ABC transporter permease [Nanoarchaeota archaeon]
MQKLDTTLLNDIKLFIRDPKSLILVMLTPFLILSILINIYYFSDVSETIKGVDLGVCDLDNSDFDLESSIFKVIRFTNNCNTTIADQVARGEFRGAITIPKGFQQNIREGKGTELRMYIDNSKSTTAIVTSNAVKAYVADLNEQIGTKFILEAWEQLKTLNENLRFLVQNLEKAKPTAIALQERLNEINQDISTIDFNAHQQTANELISYLNLLEIQLDYIDSSITTTDTTLPSIPTITYSPNATMAITEYRLNARIYRQRFCNSSSTIPILTENPLCTILNYSDSIVDTLEGDVSNLTTYRDDLNKRIQELNKRSAELNQSITRLADLVSDNSGTNSELRGNIQDLKDTITFLEDKTNNITKTITELNHSLNKFLSDTIRVTDELKATIDVLDSYTKKDPSTILKPVTVDSKKVFKDKLEIFYRLPALMSIILLFIILFISSSLIVNERKGGTMARIFLSPISMFFYVFEKILYLLILSILAVFSMILATFLFHVTIPITLQLIAVFILASLVYISLGTLIGAFSKTENTSLLTCLVIGFPLMFMSGAFSPPELMGKAVRSISQYLPLTLNINLLENITIYNTGLDPTRIFMMAGMIIIFYMTAVLLIRRRPTLK